MNRIFPQPRALEENTEGEIKTFAGEEDCCGPFSCCSRRGFWLSVWALLLLVSLTAVLWLVSSFGLPPPAPVTRACATASNQTGFLCDDRQTCVPASLVCDGVRTCPRGEDEDSALCGKCGLEPSLALRERGRSTGPPGSQGPASVISLARPVTGCRGFWVRGVPVSLCSSRAERVRTLTLGSPSPPWDASLPLSPTARIGTPRPREKGAAQSQTIGCPLRKMLLSQNPLLSAALRTQSLPWTSFPAGLFLGNVPHSLPSFLVFRCSRPTAWTFEDKRCDGSNDCGDCSDEGAVARCPPCGPQGWGCTPTFFQYCGCVPRRLCRDGVQHCSDWSDEYACPGR
ncbi:low-density lipoprotein receptor class A domain-containing protein 1 [Monodelphis domestica]|uniref:low-density lipoprotein receptor class A domain-containing protein 1 n=1 Tax=Monodelphis domestica TaxID=13616 RepID=UPI0024E25D18|nr:low-density lipoprotein receptor class A domain-containing protein 1 [Monodelphis domestica]